MKLLLYKILAIVVKWLALSAHYQVVLGLIVAGCCVFLFFIKLGLLLTNVLHSIFTLLRSKSVALHLLENPEKEIQREKAFLGSACGRAVTSDTRDPRFKS